MPSRRQPEASAVASRRDGCPSGSPSRWCGGAWPWRRRYRPCFAEARGGGSMNDDREAPVEGNGPLASHGILAKLSWALRSEPGEVRPHNEDFGGAFAPTTPDDAWDRGPVFAVCDGLGGHAAGEVASRTAVEALLASWTQGSPSAPHKDIRTAAR